MIMNEKKNIDRLFQEKFKNFEVTPDDAVWEKIKAKKDNKKRVIILPLWYRIAGVAALIVAILSIGSFFIKSNSQQIQIVTLPAIEKVNEISTENPNTTEKRIATPNESKDTYHENASKNSKTNNEAITNKKAQNKDKKEVLIPNISKRKNTAITDLTNTNSSTKEKNNTSFNSTIITDQKTNKQQKDDPILSQQKSTFTATAEKQKTAIPKSQKENIPYSNLDIRSSDTTHKSIVENDKIDENNNISREKKKAQFTDIQDENLDRQVNLAENSAKTDSLQIEESVSSKTSIFDAIITKEEEESKVAQTTIGKRWNIAPSIAPVYYNPTGNASTVDSEFSDNSKNGQVNMSYGIQVAYHVNKKLSIRSGINKLDVGYNTEGIGFSATTAKKSEEGIEYNITSQNIEIFDFVEQQASFTNTSDISSRNLSTEQNLGLLNHRIGYIEVPLEMTYALSNKKLGVHMIGGVSTLFLEDDEVSITAGDFKTDLGEGTNVNNVSFSGNLGLGLDYKLSKQFHINMEPIFKYQFNGFKETADNFKPYYFGIYTGVSFEF